MTKSIVNFRWSPDLIAAVDAAAKSAGLTRTKWVEQALWQAAGTTVAAADNSEPKQAPKGKLPPDHIRETDCPHPWSAYRRTVDGLYCSNCRKFVVEEIT